MLIIGLTGGIGSGKTAASDWFAEQSVDVIDADIVAREVVAVGSPALAHIQDAFGDWVLSPTGELNRAALREHIFNNPDAREKLEFITHPAIRKRIKAQIENSKSIYTILVAPLLLEGGKAGLAKFCQRVLVVDIPETLQLERAGKRDKQNQEQIKRIMQAQLSRQDRLSQADDVVDNSQDLAFLYSQLDVLHEKYLKLARQS